MATLQDLIDSNKKVADAVLTQSAKLAQLLPIFDQLRRDVYDILQDRTIERERVDQRLRNIEGHLGAASKDLDAIKTNVDEAAEDIEQIHRDITNPFIKVPTPEQLEEKKPAMVRMIEALERTSMKTKIWIFFIVVVVAAGGWLHTIISKLLSGD